MRRHWRFAAAAVLALGFSVPATAQNLDDTWLRINVKGTGLNVDIADDSVRTKGRFKGVCYMHIVYDSGSDVYTGETACEIARGLWAETNGGPTFTLFSDGAGVAVSSMAYYTNRNGWEIEGNGTFLLTPVVNKKGVLKTVRVSGYGEINGNSSLNPGVSRFFGGYQVRGARVLETRVPDDAFRSLAPHPAPSSASANDVLALVNNHRTNGAVCGGQALPAVSALQLDSGLNEAAALHALDMARFDYFSHTGRNGSSHTQRIRDAGFNGSPTGENIAAGYGTPAAVVAGWMSSDGHCRNIMNASYTYMGLGHATMGNSTYGTYWTQTFGGN